MPFEVVPKKGNRRVWKQLGSRVQGLCNRPERAPAGGLGTARKMKRERVMAELKTMDNQTRSK